MHQDRIRLLRQRERTATRQPSQRNKSFIPRQDARTDSLLCSCRSRCGLVRRVRRTVAHSNGAASQDAQQELLAEKDREQAIMQAKSDDMWRANKDLRM